jgi:hypothetical protein
MQFPHFIRVQVAQPRGRRQTVEASYPLRALQSNSGDFIAPFQTALFARASRVEIVQDIAAVRVHPSLSLITLNVNQLGTGCSALHISTPQQRLLCRLRIAKCQCA